TCLVPQGLIASIAVLFSYADVRISRLHSLVRKINAVESLGSVTIVCTDKTGTITQTNLSVHHLITRHAHTQHEAEPSHSQVILDMTQHNITAAAIAAHLPQPAQDSQVLTEVPFKSSRKWSGLTVASAAGSTTYLLGAPEVMLTQPQLQQYQHHL